MKERLLALLGPTATGKSRLSLLLAPPLGAEIISGDSMLVYRGLDIGTAKPSREERASVKHHLIDILPPEKGYSAALFQRQAARIISDLNNRGRLPILVGGTGLYAKGLLEGYSFTPARKNETLRAEFAEFADTRGDLALFERLAALSPVSAARTHPHNRQRVVRALEAVLTGAEISADKQPEPVYDAAVFGLYAPREELYALIDERVEQMFSAGLLREARSIMARGVPDDSPALCGIGYKEALAHLKGEYGIDECMALVARRTRRFAKRQFTWFKKMPYINWLRIGKHTDYAALCALIQEKLVQWRN